MNLTSINVHWLILFVHLTSDNMVETTQFLKRGWEILNRHGPVALASRSLTFVIDLIKDGYYGQLAKQNSPIDYHGVSLPLDMPIFDNHIRRAFVTGLYEAEEVELIDEYVTGQYDLIDLGASTGFSTVYALNRLDEKSRTVAVEANPEMIDVVRTVRELNDANLSIEHAAYQPSRSEVTFHVHGKTVSGSTKEQGEREITVPAVSLTDLLSKYGIRDFVCLADIEGGEIDLFRHDMDILEDRCALVVVELHEIDGIAAESVQLLTDSAFELVDNVGDVYVYRNESLHR